jgi:hypothetical protein
MRMHTLAGVPAFLRGPALFNRPLARIGFALLLAGSIAGCTAANPLPLAADPSDPDVPVRAASYRPVLSGYTAQRPVDPKSWREQNERVAPKGGAR